MLTSTVGNRVACPKPTAFDALARRFETAPPSAASAYRLLRRKDTKFLVPATHIIWILSSVAESYRLIDGGAGPLASYQTHYFDTSDLLFFHQHRRGVRPRHKLRIRRYLDLGRAFFEVKSKEADGQTDKFRIEQIFASTALGPEARQLACGRAKVDPSTLQPIARVDYRRMTLINKRSLERVTIDLGLRFRCDNFCRDLPALALVETKQPKRQHRTPIIEAMQSRRLQPSAASKYCLAVSLARPELPRWHVSEALRSIEKVEAL